MSEVYKFKFEEHSVYANVAALVPQHQGIHIDLGCGFGAIAEELSAKGIRYIGFDANKVAVQSLVERGFEAHVLDLVHLSDLASWLGKIQTQGEVVSLSAIDVIEHLDEPIEFLSLLHSLVPDTACLILSIPNFSHYDVAIKLMAGRWDERESGILDRTHRHVYTESKLQSVTSCAGWVETGGMDYHIEISEQYENGLVLHNREVGFFGLIRELFSRLNPSIDVYQFVRIYKKGQSATLIEKKEKDRLLSIVVESEAGLDLLRSPLPNVQFIVISDELSSNFGSVDALVIPKKEIKNITGYIRGRYVLVDPALQVIPSDFILSFSQILKRFNASPVIEIDRSSDGIHVLPFEEFNEYPSSAVSRCILFPSDLLGWLPFRGGDSFVGYISSIVFEASVLAGFVRVGSDLLTFQCRSKTATACDAAVTTSISSSGRLDRICTRFLANADALSDMEALIASLKGEVEILQSKYDKVINSSSWAITRPLRAGYSVLWRVKAILRGIYRASSGVARGRFFIRNAIDKGIRSILDLSSSRKQGIYALQALAAGRNDINERSEPEEFTNLPEVDVSVVLFNSKKWIDAFLKSLAGIDYPKERLNLFFVDNSSSDGTADYIESKLATLRREYASASLLRQPNLGFGAGHNAAILSGKADYVLVTNVDLEFEIDSIRELMRHVVGKSAINVASWELRQLPYEHPKHYDPVTLETNWSSHACILMRRDAYLRVGGYEPRIFMYAEDVELSYRFRSFGYRLKYCPNAVVRHYSYAEAGQVKPLQFSGSTLGNAYVRLRYGTWMDKCAILPLYGALFFWPSQYPGAKKDVLRNVGRILRNFNHMLHGAGPEKVYFPFRIFDYEMIREGAFYEVARCITGPLVSVIVRTYRGRTRFLQESIYSLLNQTYRNLEVLVVEDGGAEMQAVVENISRYSGINVRYISCEKVGRSMTGNAGLAAAHGEYMMFLDDDDLLFSDHIEVLMAELIRSPKLDAAYALAVQVYTRRDDSGYQEERFEYVDTFRQEWDYSVLQDHNFLPIQSVLFHRRLYERWGGFELDMEMLEDWNLWLRYGFGASFKYVPKTTSIFRVPAEDNVRMQRHLALHAAYQMAKSKAQVAIAKQC
ncbi:glycosyltransferase [Chitiniphilus purpureus]|uniref:Glycosyltransferase n=1 Tax=Chitiniphilus purpureus TaxID=2981137 RepID=A0ABY6DMD2_9NEIS|nr:glycosyltransferase [Chitiniphilus sp. CD1]UXY15535.1 glycosyltransferase [Chitiniphilus sp. CD1]